jgi:hypothetical protein
LTALAKGQLPLAQLFLDCSDLRVNTTSGNGVTALMMAASLGCSLSISKLLRHSDIDVHYRVQTTEMLWGSLPVTKEWSAQEIASSKGFRYLEDLLSTFSPDSSPPPPARQLPAIRSSASALPRSYKYPESWTPEVFPKAPTHNFVSSRSDFGASESKICQGSFCNKEESGYDFHREKKTVQSKYVVYGNKVQADEELKSGHETLDTGLKSSSVERGSSNGFEKPTPVCVDCSDQIDQYTSSRRKSRRVSILKDDAVSKLKKPIETDTSTSGGKDRHGGCSYSFSTLTTTTIKSAVRSTANSSDVLSYVQPGINSSFMAPATSATKDFGQRFMPAGREAQSTLCAKTTEAQSMTVKQNVFHSSSVSTSDGINWGIAAPATIAAILSVGLAGYALKTQRNGVESQSHHISATHRMNGTLQKMEESLSSILGVIQASQSLLSSRSGDPSPHPSPDLPTFSPEHIPTVRYLAGRFESLADLPEPQGVLSVSLDSDSESEYTSEDHVLDEFDPHNSVKLTSLDTPRSKIGDGNFELSEEDVELFENLHEEMSDFDLTDFGIGGS